MDEQTVGNILQGIPQTVQDGLLINLGTNFIWYPFASISAKIAKKFWEKVLSRGLTEEKIEKKAFENEEFARGLSKILNSVGTELIEEKLDAWTELVLLVYAGKSPDNGCTVDDYNRWLTALSPREILVLGEIYKGDDALFSIIQSDFLVEKLGLNDQDLFSIFQHLGSLGLVMMQYDKTGYYGREGEPNLTGLYYTRNSAGKSFFEHILRLKTGVIV